VLAGQGWRSYLRSRATPRSYEGMVKTANISEDWFNHVIPALMYFRSLVEHAGINVYNFTIDAHSEAGHRGRAIPPLGEAITAGNLLVMYPANPTYDGVLSEARLRRFVTNAASSLE
ncbi:hypothetical protein ACV1CV_22380, partial [Aeromonas veronii]